MKKIVSYLHEYYTTVDKRILLLSTFFTGTAIFFNYLFCLNKAINHAGQYYQFLSWYIIFLTAFSFPVLLWLIIEKPVLKNPATLVMLMLLVTAIFAWKMSIDVFFHFTGHIADDRYWNQIIYWPFKLFVIVIILYCIWKILDKEQPFYGLTAKNFNVRPYALMLMVMVPLIAIASTQKDFLHMYPKLKIVQDLIKNKPHNGLYKILFELSYGTDFFSIELFFRGFLILAFSKWLGKNAILPMAVFYCTIHFGKPLGECISSYFGGIILGVITYNNRTIYGGLIIHLGIAWLMELGGYLGNLYYH